MPGGETIAASVFYLGLAAFVVGTMLAAQRAIERRGARPCRRAFALIAGGLVGILAAIAIFATGPRGVLPF